jgi:hypothetical protein
VTVWLSSLPESLPVEPGAQASCRVTVRNDSNIVDEFALEVLGDAAAWTAVEPQRLSLMPGTTADVTLTFRPPRDSSLTPGPRPVGLKAVSVERPETSTVVEGKLDVQPFGEYSLELIPRTSHGTRSSKHELAFDNSGSRHVHGTITASDPDGTLRFHFSPPAIDAPPGTASFTKVRVRHRKRFMRGPSKSRPFTVVVEPEGEAPVSAAGTAVQDPSVPTWALGALVGIAALALLWFLLVKPQVKSTAKDAANGAVVKVLGPAATSATSTNPSGGAAGGGSGGGASGSGSGGSSGGSGGGSTGSGGGTSGSGSGTGSGGASGGDLAAFSKRLVVSCTGSCSDDFKVPDGKTLQITDLVLGNPNNTKGTLTIKNGSTILFVENLDNFRDLDFHFATPIIVASKETLSTGVSCGAAKCGGAAFFTGTLG